MIPVSRWCGGTKEEYETQHFGFGAQLFKKAVREMVEETISTCVKDMDTNLQENLNLNQSDKSTLTHSCDRLIRLYCERADSSLKNIDQEIEKILNVPSNTLLPEDEEQSDQLSDEDYEKLKEEVSELRLRIERSALMEMLLTAEEEELISSEKVIELTKKDMHILDLLDRSLDSQETVKSVQNVTQSLCQDLTFMNKEQELFDD